MLLTALFCFGGVAFAANVVFNITPSPSERASGGNVTFEFNVTSDTAYPDCRIYFNNSDVSGSLGNLNPGQTQPGSFDMNVSDSMLGQPLVFQLKSGGGEVLGTKTVVVNKKTLSIQLNASAKPSRSLAGTNNALTLSITLENNGEADITDIVVKAAGLNDGKMLTSAAFPLGAGKSHTVNYSFTMGSKDMTITPTIDYSANGAAQPQIALDPITITLESRQVSATVTPSTKTPQPGEEVTFTLAISNGGNVAYTDMSVMMNGQSVKFPTSKLNPGDSVSQTYTESFQVATDVVFTITLKDHTGAVRTVDSNTVTITLPVDAGTLSERLQFTMSVDRSQLTSGGVVNFTGFIHNGTDYALSAVSVDEPEFGNIFSASSLAPGQRANIEWSTNIDETTTYNFVLTFSDAEGNPYTIHADAIPVTIQSAEPTPTDFDDAVTLEPDTDGGLGTTGVLLVIAGILVLLIIGVGVALLVLWKKGKSGKKMPPGRKRPPVSRGSKPAPRSYRDRNNF